MAYLLVFLGGGIGAALRHGVSRAALVWFGAGFPVGTLLVNVSGGLLMGILAALLTKGTVGEEWRLFLATGILGGFTTFSAFSLDAALMWERGDYLICAAYVGGSVILSICGLFAGLAIARTAF